MLWEIRGTRSGKAIRAKVAADSEESARRKAAANGVAVISVTLMEDPSAPAQAAAPEPSPDSANPSPEAPSDPVEAAPPPDASASPPPYVPAAPLTGNAAAVAPPFAQPIQYAVPPQYVPGGQGGEKFSGLSIASLVCGCASAVLLICLGVIGWILGGAAGIVGLVLGIIAWKSAKAKNNNKDRKMAIAGTFTSMGALVIHLLFVIVAASFLIFAIMASKPPSAPASTPPPTVLKVLPPAPTASELASKLRKIDGTWKPAGSVPTDLLATMKGHNISTDSDGNVIVASGSELKSAKTYKVPSTFRIVLLTDDKDTRITFGQTNIIFNWDGGIDELRVDGGPANGKHKPGAGRLPYAQWVAIELVVHANEMILYVDGNERYRTKADFFMGSGTLALKANGGALKVKSVSVLPQ